MNTLILLRGLPGSGKSAFTNCLLEHTYISMDDFWTGPDRGEESGKHAYKYDPLKIKDAVTWAAERLRVSTTVHEDHLVVVDNTHTRLWEMEQVIILAKSEGYRVHIVHIEEDLFLCHRRCTHPMPFAKLQEMATRWEPVVSASPWDRVLGLEREFTSFLSRMK